MELCWTKYRPPRGWTYIYALVHRDYGTLFYVGQTRKGLSSRLHEHFGEREDWHITKRWGIVKLDMVQNRHADSAELHWIWEMRRRGHVLTNKRLPWVEDDYYPTGQLALPL